MDDCALLTVANLTADFSGPVNLRAIPVFTHSNGTVIGVVIEVTWDAVPAQVSNVPSTMLKITISIPFLSYL